MSHRCKPSLYCPPHVAESAQPHYCVRSVRSLHSPRLTHQRPDHTVYIVQTYEDSWCGDAFASRPCHRPVHSHSTPSARTLGTRPAARSLHYASEGCGGGPQSTPSTHGLALGVARGVVAPWPYIVLCIHQCGASCATYSRGGRGRRSWRRWSLIIHSSPHQRRTNERPHVPAASSRGH